MDIISLIILTILGLFVGIFIAIIAVAIYGINKFIKGTPAKNGKRIK